MKMITRICLVSANKIGLNTIATMTAKRKTTLAMRKMTGMMTNLLLRTKKNPIAINMKIGLIITTIKDVADAQIDVSLASDLSIGSYLSKF